MTMTIEEMKEYIAEELKEERAKMLRNEPNNYGYLFMIANDMGLSSKQNKADNTPRRLRRQERTMAKELELYKMMGMNTCHLSLDTKAVIPRMAAHTSSSVILHLKDNDFGCFIHIPDDIGECTDIPKDLKNCMIFAQNAGCEWLMFDHDAEIYDELKTYTWDGKEIQKAPSITADEVRKLAKERGNEQAYNILLLYGPDAFVGDYDEYNSLLDKLSKENEQI